MRSLFSRSSTDLQAPATIRTANGSLLVRSASGTFLGSGALSSKREARFHGAPEELPAMMRSATGTLLSQRPVGTLLTSCALTSKRDVNFKSLNHEINKLINS